MFRKHMELESWESREGGGADGAVQHTKWVWPRFWRKGEGRPSGVNGLWGVEDGHGKIRHREKVRRGGVGGKWKGGRRREILYFLARE